MKILALEPYYGGSHKAFLDGWRECSRHNWTVLTLPPNKWKWRMRHAAITFNQQVADLLATDRSWDLLFCSDMLNLAEFKGVAAEPIRNLPSIAYFHENQITYPVEHEKEYDYHFAFTNMTTALAADSVWFNSDFHRQSFLSGARDFLERMPDQQPLEIIPMIENKSLIRYPGIHLDLTPNRQSGLPIHLLWAARWEYDKVPTIFFDALDIVRSNGTEFQLSVIGGDGGNKPLPVFEKARQRFSDAIRNWGYLPARSEYEAVLSDADVIVSTAQHEFFGIGILEAVAAGAYPLVPDRLAYPEVLAEDPAPNSDTFFFKGGAKELAARIQELAARHAKNDLWQGDPQRGARIAQKYLWQNKSQTWDDEINKIVSAKKALLSSP